MTLASRRNRQAVQILFALHLLDSEMAFVCFSGLPGLIDRVFIFAMLCLTRAPVNRVNVVQHKICGGIMIVMTAEDARLCVEHGVKAVIVSHHRARQLEISCARDGTRHHASRLASEAAWG